jgi:hypothetical protein
MLEFERERSRMALELEPTQRDPFRQGRDGNSLYIPNEESVLAFQLGLDFRFKRLGVDDKISAKDIFAKGEFFASGFLTRLSILPPDSTGKIQSQEFVIAHNNSLRQRHLFNTNDWNAYIKGSLSALGVLLLNNSSELSRLTHQIEDSDSVFGNFVKVRDYQKNLLQESRDLENLLNNVSVVSDMESTRNTKVLQTAHRLLGNITEDGDVSALRLNLPPKE